MDATTPIFRLYASCRPVRGARRSLVCDLQRNRFDFIPNALYELLTTYRDLPLDALKGLYDHQQDDVLDAYYAFLVDHGYGFWCDEPERFPDLDLSWERPEAVTNALVDVDAASEHDWSSILGQLDGLGCKTLQVRYFSGCTSARLQALLEAARHGRLRAIELLVPYGSGLSDEGLAALCEAYPRLSRLVVHGAPEARNVVLGNGAQLLYRPEAVDSPRCCGEVHPAYFVADIELFTEGQQHNTCLNRKLSIDARGEIRNCPSLPEAFGNVRETPLHAVLTRPGFRDRWSITKDQVEGCRDCEFRYVCTDCRAYVAGPGGRYAKPAKCRYDPYTATWL